MTPHEANVATWSIKISRRIPHESCSLAQLSSSLTL